MSTSRTPVATVDRKLQQVAVRNWLLDGLTVSSGAVDAISFMALGKVFTAFMTGNIAFLGMALASQTGANAYGVTPPRVLSVLAAMVGFAIGIYTATSIVGKPGGDDAKKSAAAVWPHRTTVAL